MGVTISSAQVGTAVDGNDVSLTFTALENDYVLIMGGGADDGAGFTAGPTDTTYTTALSVDDTTGGPTFGGGADIGVWYKLMGASPDSAVTLTGPGGAFDAATYTLYVLTGADTATFLDGAIQTQGPTADTAGWDGPSITTSTDSCLVFTAGHEYDVANFNVNAAPTGYSNLQWGNPNETNRFIHGAAAKSVASAGTENPGAFSLSTGTSRHYEITLAVRESGGAPPAAASVIRRLAMMGVGR